MKKTPYDKALAPQRRAAALALGISCALASLASPAHAQQASVPAAPQLAITKPAAVTPPSAESLATPPVHVYRPAAFPRTTEPTGKPPATESDATSTVADATAAPAVKFEKPAEKDMPFILGPELRTWPLQFFEQGQLNTLYFTVPSEQDARIMLPGNAADLADQVRFAISRYITDSIGAAAQARGRQLEMFSSWLANHDAQKKALPNDPWAAYQFSQESYPLVQAFKEKVTAQTALSVGQMVKDVNLSVAKITPVMESTGSYELKVKWYNILVQLKEGVGLYQGRAADGDRQILEAIAAFEAQNPPAPRPPGRAPRKVTSVLAEPAAKLTPATQAELAPRREAAKPLPNEAPPSQTGGIVVLLGMAAVVFGLFMKLRNRVAKKGAAKTGASD